MNISFDAAENNFIDVKVYELNGQLLIQQKEFAIIGQQIILLDIAPLSSGSYFVQIENGKKGRCY